jgi:hypothetical protein
MLVKIRERHCPHCASPAVEMGLRTGVDGQVQIHCNGQRWEWVKFGCGLKLEWIPNLEGVEEHGECRNDETVKCRKQAYNSLINGLIGMIKDSRVSDYSKQELISLLSWRVT